MNPKRILANFIKQNPGLSEEARRRAFAEFVESEPALKGAILGELLKKLGVEGVVLLLNSKKQY